MVQQVATIPAKYQVSVAQTIAQPCVFDGELNLILPLMTFSTKDGDEIGQYSQVFSLFVVKPFEYTGHLSYT
jgi:hypothetical protein